MHFDICWIYIVFKVNPKALSAIPGKFVAVSIPTTCKSSTTSKYLFRLNKQPEMKVRGALSKHLSKEGEQWPNW